MDHIQQLLLQTGWSCEDLISKLNEFKQKSELKAKQAVQSNGISHKEDSEDIIKDCDVAQPKINNEIEEKINLEEESEQRCDPIAEKINLEEEPKQKCIPIVEKINLEEEPEQKCDFENKEDGESNGLNHNEDESKEDITEDISKSDEKSNEQDEIFEEKMELDDDIVAKTEENKENVSDTQKTLDNTIKKKRKFNFVPHKICTELFDHTYTLNMKPNWTGNDYPRKSHKFKTISKSRRLSFLQKSRKFRKLLLKQKKIDRKLLIAQYKSPETVRSQIMEQLQLLRSRRSEYSITVKPSKDKIVSKKRYTGEKWSTIINELMQLAEDQSVEIESNDILQNQCDIMIENNFNKKANSNSGPKCITETLKNRIGNLSNEPLPGTSSSFVKSKNDTVMDVTEDKPSGLKNIMIVDVRGGCEIIPDNKVQDEIVEDKKYTIKPTKTNDITKIKGWKNKTFSVSNQNKLKLNNSSSSEAAFSSSNLDGFLEAADLHISFKIPTLESGVSPGKETKKTQIIPAQTSPKEPDKDLLNLFHPRTLGQKKRIMTLKRDGRWKKNSQKPRTLAEKRRLMGNETFTRVFKEIQKSHSAESKDFNSSYVLYRGKKLKVVTKNQNGIIAYIKSINKPLCSTFAPKKMKIIKAKPSIFNNIYSPTSTVLRYRPGPLCKKADLQYNNQNWKTTLKKLPKVKLLVVPEFKKPVHPYVEFLMPKYDFEITSDRLEFALTALPPKQSKEITCFDFNVPYQNNQEDILLRAKNTDASILNKVEPSKIVDYEKIDDICRDVMDKIIDYVEIKEISDDVIKSDVNRVFMEEDKKFESQGKRAKKLPRKSNKTSNELKRLSVKVIEVNLEEKDEVKNCQKDFCRLGCVCRSLSTNSSLVLTHCGRVECMFRCDCNYDQTSKGNIKVTLPTGVDLLSEGAVNRLENVAKRNLAKVEKEFTQTVIKSNNQTIIVGGCSNRQRRVSKLPRKYDEEHHDIFANSEIYEDLDLRQYQLRNSQVSLTKINLDDIVPYCLTHRTYDCECKCMADYVPSEESDDMPSDDEEYFPDRASYNKIMEISNKMQYPSFVDSCSRVKGIPTDYYLIRNRTKTFIKMRNRKFVRNMNRFWLKHDMDVDIEGRPRTPETEPTTPAPTNEFIKVTSEKSRRKQELVVRGDGDVAIISPHQDVLTKPRKLRPIKPKIPPPPLPNTFTTKDVFMKYKLKENPLFKNRKVKNSLRIHEIKQLESSLKTSSKQFEENSIQITESIKLFSENLKQVEEASNSVKEDLKRVDENIRLIQEDSKAMKKFKMIFSLIRENQHYFHPSPDIADRFMNMLGKKEDTTFILLQWKTLAYYYQSGKVYVWFSSYYNSPKIIITDLFIRPKHFTNVKHFENSHNKFLLKNEIIRALITGNIPGNNPTDDIQVILELSDMLCYVHGTFQKNHNKDKNISQKRHSKKDKDKEKKSANTTQDNKSKDLPQDTIILQENHCEEPIILNTSAITPPNMESLSITTISKTNALITKSDSLTNSKSPITVTKAKTTQNDSSHENIEISEVDAEKEKVPFFNYPTVRKIMYSKYKCQQYNYVSIDKDNENVAPCTVRARLPLIKKSSLWRMIKLNSDFSVLSLDKSDYRIKYSDLQKVLRMSDDKEMTIAIRTEQPSTQIRPHKDFGIYASPISPNCVFIGPYLQIEDHDVVLMRYLNRELITTDKFNSMKGLPRTNSGVWLQQKRDFVERNVHTIDLTESDHEANKSDDDDDDDEEDENRPILTTRDLEIFENDAANYHYNFQTFIEIDITKMNFQNMSVLYFYTNVKGLGYIIGNQVGKDTVILKYPDAGKALQFRNKTAAIEFLEKELSASFIEAAGFKIKITVYGPGKKTTNIFNKNLLKGYYVVNEAGFTNVLEITPAKLRELNMTETKFCRGVSNRAARVVYDQTLEASKYCTGAPFVHTRKSTVALLKWLIEEVEELKAENDRQTVQLTVLHQQRPMLVEHFKEVYLDLAPKADSKLKTKMEELLVLNGISMDEPKKSSETTPKTNDVICIDIDRSSPSSPQLDQHGQTKLPIYTTNPDIIITATTKKDKQLNNPDTKLPKVSVKDISTLKEKVEEKVEVNKNDVNKNGKSKTNKSNKTYKYLFKTTKGKLIEIAPEQYEILKANKMKTATTTNSQDNTFQLGSLTITPKLSKGGLEPIISNLPAAELKNIVIPDNLPPGFVKLTLKNVQKGTEPKPNSDNT